MDFVLGRVIPFAVYGGMFGYPVLQYLAIYWTRGRWQVYASLPLVPMAVLLAVAGLNGSGADGWSLLLVVTAPLALVYLAVLLALHRRARVGAASARPGERR